MKESDRIMLRGKGGMVFININDIYYFYFEEKRKIKMSAVGGNYIIHENLKDIYEKLRHEQFYMCHKSCIINLYKVKGVVNNYDIVMENGDLLPLAQSKKSEFYKRLSLNFTTIFIKD